ncbi:MAG: DUF1318 domain-containing protein [Leptospira sp.]|nr:DUF1318 domain-containing protein [Leptospira sp.]
MNRLRFLKDILFCILLMMMNIVACSLKAPGITFTQTQTASERQMVGEDKEIEKDGWLISSIKSSSSGSDLWERDVTRGDIADRNHLILLKKLAYLTPEVKELKLQGVVGESFDGSVKRIKNASLPKEYSEPRIKELLDRVNKTRKEVIAIQVSLEADRSKEEVEKTMKEYYFNSVEYGEFYEASSNKWERKEAK